MGILTYLKLGAIGLVIIVGGYFIWNYNHMQNKITALQVQVEEQTKTIEFYEKAAEVDKTTQETQNEIQKAVNNADLERIRELYRMLRSHKRIPSNSPSETNNDGDE